MHAGCVTEMLQRKDIKSLVEMLMKRNLNIRPAKKC